MTTKGGLRKQFNLIGAFKELGTTKERRQTLLGIASTRMLVQLMSMPVALTIPSVAKEFGTSPANAAWMVIIRLLAMGSTVFLAARLGEKYGHVRVYFVGGIIMCVAGVLAAVSFSMAQLILWSGVAGIGGALINANSNAILTMVFGAKERGRAFSVPITAAKVGQVVGLVVFGVFLEWLSWRLVFLTTLPIGLLAIKNSYPMLKFKFQDMGEKTKGISIDYFGAALMAATLGVLILSVSHLHEGVESFTSPAAKGYHLPMHLLAAALFVLFLVTQLRSSNPFLQFRHFKNKYFDMALFSGMTFHMSMLAVMTLVPIVVQNGLGKSPMAVTMVLLPYQLAGLVLPSWAGMIYDKYEARWLQPIALMLIALGIGLLALFSAAVPIWALPILLFPASIGSSVFNAPNNAQIMTSLPESRSFAAGMLETTTQMGHTIGSTIGATVMGLTLPAAIALLPTAERQYYYREGFQNAAMTVVGIIILGSLVAVVRKASEKKSATGASPVAAAPSGAGDGDG
ncbi:MAG: MFS transporter [Dehalococcoidia bacterium]|nr:MFS transporter [Dehalococcoidia bacterium]MSQ17028.1 MFS transporter [Dehalococcoidia bacterium]